MAYCTYSKSYIYEWLLAGSLWQPTIASTLVALWKGDPGPDLTGGEEVSGGGYTRAAVGASDWELHETLYRNKVAIIFPEATEDWGTVSHIAILSYAGFGLMYDSLTSPKDVPEGSTPRFKATELMVVLI